MIDEMQVLAGRLKVEVHRAGGPKAFAKACGVPLSTLNTYLSGEAEPKIMTVVKIAQALGLTVAELLSEPGDPESQINRTESQIDDDSIQIGILDAVGSAGPGIESPSSGEPPLRSLPFSRKMLTELGVKQANARFLPSRGDSMEPNIKENAVVLVDVSHSRAKDDGVYVLVVGNDVRIKRIGRSWDGAVELISDNPLYPNDKLSAPEAEALRIAGKVVWAGGRI